jgi:hypothetical protein
MSRFFSFVDRYLDPAEQLGQILFGLIMVLIFTLGAGSIVSKGDDATRDLLLSVLGCNVAWGVIQGWMFVIDSVYERSHNARLVRLVQEAADQEQAIAVLKEELDPELEEVTSAEGRIRLYEDISNKVKNIEVPKHKINRHDLYGSIAVFALVLLTVIPALVPFLIIENLKLALRVSNLLLVGLLFLSGYRWASLTNTNRWRAGLGIMLGGVAMVAIAESLGG